MTVRRRSKILDLLPRGDDIGASTNGKARTNRVAVIDIGSNSTRMEVLQLTADYDLRVISEVKKLLRLQTRMSSDGRFSKSVVSDLSRQIDDFAIVAKASYVDRIRAVATSAIRNAVNRIEVVNNIKQSTGIDVEIISAAQEAEYGFLGAVFSLPVHDGVLIDIGGGSVEFSLFKSRELTKTYSLELGALRVSDDFLSDPEPNADAVRNLRRHVRQLLEDAEMPILGDGANIVGAGGTIRNLARMDRETRRYSFGRLHGTVVRYGGLKRVVNGLRGLERANLAHVPGLNPERVDSILGGAIVASEIVRHFDKRPLIVSGRGIREGLAISGLVKALPSVKDVRDRSIYALGARFDTWDRLRADRRSEIASKMAGMLSDFLTESLRDLIPHVARMIDTGRSVNYYDRYEHAANIVELGELGGFSHRDISIMSACLRFGDRNPTNFGRYRPELTKSDRPSVRRASNILRLADEIERRLGADRVSAFDMQRTEHSFEVDMPELRAWDPGKHAVRFKRLYKLEFVVAR